MNQEQRQTLIDLLHKSGASCVIRSGDEIRLCRRRGVEDLYRLLCHEPHLLRGAFVADKVVGKGAAALLVVGGVGELFADVVSASALELLRGAGLRVAYREVVPHIINRSGTGVCPVERLCAACVTAAECLPLIAEFLGRQSREL